jgi:predicted metalloprotease with PDZ domain
VGTTVPLPYAEVFASAGIAMTRKPETADDAKLKSRRKILGGLGLEVDDQGALVKVTNAVPGGPAADAGLTRDDLLLAIDGRRLTKDNWRRLLGAVGPGQVARIAHFRHEALREAAVHVAANRRLVTRLAPAKRLSAEQRRVGAAWLPKVRLVVPKARGA